MRILVICQYYPPDIGGGSRRVSNAVCGLERKGHAIEIITAFPHYPHGKIPRQYRSKILAIETMHNRRVFRVWVPPIAHRGFARRLIMYLLFSISALFALAAISRPDVIWAANTNVFSSFPAKIYSIIWRAPLVRNVDDLWPETALEEGIINSTFARIGEVFAKMAYSTCKAITAISSTYIKTIVMKYGISSKRIFVAEVGVDTKVFHPPRYKPRAQAEFNDFRVVYSGILGPGYDFDTIIKAASKLQSVENIEFIIRGSGESTNEILNRINIEKLTNIKLDQSYLTTDELVSFLGSADILLLPMKSQGFHSAGIPTKLFEYMACGKPIICTCTDATKRIIKRAQCGIVVRPGNSDELSEAILVLKSNPKLCQKFGERGRDYVLKEYSIKRIGEKLEHAFNSALMGER